MKDLFYTFLCANHPHQNYHHIPTKKIPLEIKMYWQRVKTVTPNFPNLFTV